MCGLNNQFNSNTKFKQAVESLCYCFVQIFEGQKGKRISNNQLIQKSRSILLTLHDLPKCLHILNTGHFYLDKLSIVALEQIKSQQGKGSQVDQRDRQKIIGIGRLKRQSKARSAIILQKKIEVTVQIFPSSHFSIIHGLAQLSIPHQSTFISTEATSHIQFESQYSMASDSLFRQQLFQKQTQQLFRQVIMELFGFGLDQFTCFLQFLNGMNNFTNTKIKRSQKVVQPNFVQVASKSKYRVILNESANRRYDNDNLKNLTRKSIDVSFNQATKQANTIYQQNQSTKPYYRRVANNFRKQSIPQRYTQQERDFGRVSSKSPYMRVSNSRQQKQALGRVTALNKSTNKIKSGQLIKQNSPRYFYRQPRSSLSQHYDPTVQTSLHKRKISAVGDDRNAVIQEAKQLYKNSQYHKSIQILRRFLKINRSSVQGHYLLGMSLINSNDYNEGIDELIHTLQLDPKYKRSLYLVIALAFKKLQKYDQAIQILDKGLEIFKDYYDCLVYRGKLHLKKQNYYHALKDFTQAIQLNSSKGFAYIGKGTCEKELKHFDQAIETFTAGGNTDMGHICIQKRAIVYYQQGKLDLALKDLESCCQIEGNQSSTSHFYKGMINYRQSKIVQALLSFQESLKCDNHKQNVTYSIQMMMKIKIQQKDFYQAYHILNRTQNVEIDTEVLNQWKLFLEGSLFLMKKKYKEGISTFQTLINFPTFKGKYSSLKNKSQQQRYCFIKPLIHLYRAFGQLCENKSSNAEKQYLQYQQLCHQFDCSPDNLSKNYNQLIMKIYNNFPKDSRQAIEEAIRLISNKPEPYLYLAFQIVQNNFQKESEPIRRSRYLQEAIQNLSIGITHLPQLSNNHISTFYYYRAILYLYKHDFNKAVADIDKAIEKSQDNIPKYFYLRGLIFAIFGNFSQAVQDLTVSINLDQKYAKPYLQRAKCLQIQGNSNEAFLDLQRYITLAPQDQQIHKYAGYLLFQNCAYQDCLSAFSHGAEIEGDGELLLTKAKCHFLLGQDDLSITLFKKYCEMSYSSEYISDVQVMQICKKIRKQTPSQVYLKQIQVLDQLSSKNEEDCKIFKVRDMHQLKASMLLLMGDYQGAIKQFQKTLQLFNIEKIKEKEKHFIEDSQEFEDEWSEVEIKFNLSLCYLCLKEYERARTMLLQFEKSSQKGKNWNLYMDLINDIILNKHKARIELDTFEQNHRISKYWPKVEIPGIQVALSMAFSYPFVEPPELLPQFDQTCFGEFMVSKSQQKPEAPWINRSDGGLVFTPNIQIYENLQLSMTTTKKNDSDKDKPVSEMQKSINMSRSDIQLETEDLKKKFKLDSMVEMKLKRLMKKQ